MALNECGSFNGNADLYSIQCSFVTYYLSTFGIDSNGQFKYGMVWHKLDRRRTL